MKAPSREECESLYNQQVKFIEHHKKKNGIDYHINAQEALIKRCDDIYLESHSIAINMNIAFVEWTIGLKNSRIYIRWYNKIKIYEKVKVKEHRDYFDFYSVSF